MSLSPFHPAGRGTAAELYGHSQGSHHLEVLNFVPSCANGDLSAALRSMRELCAQLNTVQSSPGRPQALVCVAEEAAEQEVQTLHRRHRHAVESSCVDSRPAHGLVKDALLVDGGMLPKGHVPEAPPDLVATLSHLYCDELPGHAEAACMHIALS